MNRRVELKTRGLVTAPNPLATPDGSLSKADNIVLTRPGYIQSRTGLAKLATGPGGEVHSVFVWGDNIFAHYGNATTASSLKYWNGISWTALASSYSLTLAVRAKTAVVGGNLYVAGNDVLRVEDDLATEAYAGIPKALGLDRYGPANVLTGTGGFLTDGWWCAYRAVIGYKSSSEVVLLGAPSSRTVITNATGTSGWAVGVAKNVVARILLPKAINTASTALTTSYFVQLYRSPITNNGAASDEMQLVAEQFLTAGNVSSGYVDVTDICPEAFRGAYLYTNASAGDPGLRPGIANSNEPPPAARCMAYWRGCMWYGYTTSRHRFALQVLGTGSTGLAATHTLTIAGVTYTAIAPGAPAANQFVVETSGTASQNIEDTCINLVSCINKSASNTLVYAYYVSGSAPDAPGKIVIETRLQSAASGFTVAASANGSAYLPNIGSAQSSAAETIRNGLSFSKPEAPEAVPLFNNFSVGEAGLSIRALSATQDALFVWTDGGLFRVIGTDYSNFEVELFDGTAVIAGPQLACVADGVVYAMTTQGACRVSMSGLQYISADVDSDLRADLLAAGEAAQVRFGFCVAHVQDHRVEFWIATDPAEDQAGPTRAYCYDTRGNSWTRRYFSPSNDTADFEPRMGAAYDADSGTLWMCGAQTVDGEIYYENRAGTSSDYQDTLSDDTTTGVYREVEWDEQDGGDASQGKSWRELQAMWGDAAPDAAIYALTSSEGQTETSILPATANSVNRIPIGRGAARGTRLHVNIQSNDVREGFDLAGVALYFRPYGPRSVR